MKKFFFRIFSLFILIVFCVALTILPVYGAPVDDRIEDLRHEHTEVLAVVDPTCDQDGYTLHTCHSCNYTYKDNFTPALGHKWKEHTLVISNTSKEMYMQYKCEACGAMKLGDQPVSSSSQNTNKPNQRTNNYLSEQANTIFYWYVWVRNYLAVPILIVTFAWCGLSISFSAFSGNTQAVSKAKEKAFYAILAFCVLMALPLIVRYTRNIVESTAWKP